MNNDKYVTYLNIKDNTKRLNLLLKESHNKIIELCNTIEDKDSQIDQLVELIYELQQNIDEVRFD